MCSASSSSVEKTRPSIAHSAVHRLRSMCAPLSYSPILHIQYKLQYILLPLSRTYALRSYVFVSSALARRDTTDLTGAAEPLPSYCSGMQHRPIHFVSLSYAKSEQTLLRTAKKASDVTTLLFSELVNHLYVSRAKPPLGG